MRRIVIFAMAVCMFLFAGFAGGAGAQEQTSGNGPASPDHSGHMHSSAASQRIASNDPGDPAMQEAGSSARTVGIVSLLFAGLASSLAAWKIRRRRPRLSSMSGMMAAMSIGMMTGQLIGTIVGVMLAQMLVPAAIAVAAGMAAGYFAGQPHGLLASMDGMLAGVMGGMMGAMLGFMVAGDAPVLTVLFIDLIFVVLLLPLNALLNEKEQPKTETTLDEAL